MQDDSEERRRWTVDGDGCLVDFDGDRFGGPTVEINSDSYDALVDMVRRQDAQFDRALLAESICRKIVTGGPFAWGGPTVEINSDSYDALVDMVRRQDAQFDRALLAESICRKIVTGGPFAWHQFTDAEVAYLHSLEIEGPS